MNTSMNNRYIEMHTDLLNTCSSNNLKLIPGKRASQEIKYGVVINGLKDFLLRPDDMEKFFKHCRGELEAKGYLLAKGKAAGGEICRLYAKDLLGTTVPSLMKNPEGKHSPQIIIRQLIADGDSYRFTANGNEIAFKQDILENMCEVEYMGGFVYVRHDAAEHILEIYGEDAVYEKPAAGYGLFSAYCSSQEFIEEAVKRGYISEKQIARHQEHARWKKETRSEIEKKYQEYQETLLGLKLT